MIKLLYLDTVSKFSCLNLKCVIICIIYTICIYRKYAQ